jgi:hypothetical protein
MKEIRTEEVSNGSEFLEVVLADLQSSKALGTDPSPRSTDVHSADSQSSADNRCYREDKKVELK